MLKLFRKMRRREWGMAALCVLLILGQIYFDLALPEYMSDLTVRIESPESTMCPCHDSEQPHADAGRGHILG